jgi:hypothetical protein
MFMACRHIKTNGLRCKSPALKGGHFCYYHSKVHTIGSEPNAKYGPIHLPTPEDPASIQLAVAQISDAILNGRIDKKSAGHLFYGLQIAAQLIDHKRHFWEDETVQSTEQTAEGDDLAPEERICKSSDDCEGCPHAENCPNYDSGDDDDDDDDDEEDDLDVLANALRAASKVR